MKGTLDDMIQKIRLNKEMENKREELGMAEDKPRGSTIQMKFPRTKNLKGKKTMKEKNTSNNKAVH